MGVEGGRYYSWGNGVEEGLVGLLIWRVWIVRDCIAEELVVCNREAEWVYSLLDFMCKNAGL